MNPRQLSRPEVVDFARNAIKALEDGKITGLSPAEAAELAATLSAATDKLATSDQKVVATRSAYREATEDASVDEADVIGILTGLKFRMRGTGAGPDEYKAAGFDPPAGTISGGGRGDGGWRALGIPMRKSRPLDRQTLHRPLSRPASAGAASRWP